MLLCRLLLRLPWRDGRFWVGQFKQPLGMEELSSTRTGDFISKSTVTNALGLARRLVAAMDHAAMAEKGPVTRRIAADLLDKLSEADA